MSERESKPVVCCFESRRADEMSSLIERHGGVPLLAPSMQEVPIQNNPDAVSFIRRCINNEFAIVVLLTGVGTEALFDVAKSQQLYDDLLQALHRCELVIRGPKPAAVLAKVGLRYALKAPEPNTWRELLQCLDAAAESDPELWTLRDRQVAVQEYGLPNPRLYEQLQQRGAIVTAVPVYRWSLPDDTQPLRDAVYSLINGELDILMFTSAQQVANVLTVAEQEGLLPQFQQASGNVMVASIGPTCSEALQDHGFTVAFESSPPKMGPLARGAIEHWAALHP